MPRQRFEVVPIDDGPSNYVTYRQATDLVRAGECRWMEGKHALLKLHVSKSGWRVLPSAGYSVMQLL